MTATVVTATTAALTAGEVGVGLGLVMVLGLIGFLVQREFASMAGARFSSLARMLAVTIVPLLAAFVMIVASRLLAIA